MKKAWLLGLLLLAGCATVPSGPSVLVLPGSGKTFEQFQADDLVCRQWAAQLTGTTPGQASAASTAGGAAVGTVVGAAAGAALGAAASSPSIRRRWAPAPARGMSGTVTFSITRTTR